MNLWVSFGALYASIASVDAVKSCSSDTDCIGSAVCNSRKCTNPFFEKGCLTTLAERYNTTLPLGVNTRVCNSDDDATNPDSFKSSCLEPRHEYTEIRIGSGKLESSMIIGWMYQIILSEVLGVPSVISWDTNSNSNGKPSFSFYNRESRFDIPREGYPLGELVEADKHDGDCSRSDQVCSHVIPLAGDNERNIAREFIADGSIIEGVLHGTSTHYGYHVPEATLKRHPFVASHFGLRGDHNRERLASIFKVPTNWSYYCKEISKSNCADDDGVATRAPANTEEEESYFLEGEYSGYFRDNDCDDSEDCIGAVIAPPCGFTIHSYIEAQLYWNRIHLASKGPLEPNGGYEINHMVQIYLAANATQSDVFFWWHGPDPLFETFEGTEYALSLVFLPRPTAECVEYRSTYIDNCSPIKSRRVGSESTGSCDFMETWVGSLLSNGLATGAESAPIPIRSPAYAYLNQAVIPNYSIQAIFNSWTNLRKEDDVVDVEREGVCRWVYDHLEILTENIPSGYPRTFETRTFIGLSSAGLALGIVALLASIATGVLMHRWREERAIKLAQIKILSFVVLGHILLAMAGITESSAPTNATCTTAQWFVRLGYTFALLPILIKVSTINKLMRDLVSTAGARRRVEIDTDRFKRIFSMAASALVIFLAVWTIFDGPRLEQKYRMDNEDDGFVEVHVGCASSSNGWEIAAFCWEGLLLLSATILTYQSRDVIEELNESRWLAFMVYSHFLFLIIRLVVTILMFSDVITPGVGRGVVSLLLSFDALVSMGLYFGPKFLLITKVKNRGGTDFNRTGNQHLHLSNSNDRGGRDVDGRMSNDDLLPSVINPVPGEMTLSSLGTLPTSAREETGVVPNTTISEQDLVNSSNVVNSSNANQELESIHEGTAVSKSADNSILTENQSLSTTSTNAGALPQAFKVIEENESQQRRKG